MLKKMLREIRQRQRLPLTLTNSAIYHHHCRSDITALLAENASLLRMLKTVSAQRLEQAIRENTPENAARPPHGKR